MAPAPPPSRTQSRSGRTLFHHLLLLTTTVLFLCVDLLPPMASAAHVVDCRRVVFHPYCRGISARRASYTAEQMKGLNLQESDNPPFLLEDPGLPNGLNSLEQQQPQQPLPITFINEAGQPQTLEMPTSISRQLTKGKVDQEQQQQQQQQQLETERDDGGRPRESSSSSSSLLSRGQQQPLTTFVQTSLSSPSARMDPYYRHPQQQQQYYSHPRSYSYPHYSRHHHHQYHHHHHPSPSSPSSYSPISPADLYALMQREDRILGLPRGGGGHSHHRQYHQQHRQYHHHQGRQSPNSRSHRAPRHRNPFTPVAPYDLDYFPYYKRASVL